ncbi:hypothetical protein HHL19_22670 [Streptomyces sp. R302]|nr:hypothetical protein [Streptomyces sp. R301]NML81378.1 hypothetical protein [Streptomyces sp. R302]
MGADNDEGRGVALRPDGKIVAVGGSSDWGGNDAWAADRYLPDGSLDASFGEGGKVLTEIDVDAIETARSMLVQPDGRILAGGSSGGVWSLVRWDSSGVPGPGFGGDGRVTTTFGPTCCHRVADIALQDDGRIVAAGSAGGLAVTRYLADGTLDTSFDGDGWVTTGTDAPTQRRPWRCRATAGSASRAVRATPSSCPGSPPPARRTRPSAGTGGSPPPSAPRRAAARTRSYSPTVGSSWPSRYGGDFALARYNTGGALAPGFSGDGRLTTDFGGTGDAAASVALQTDGEIVAAGLAGTAFSFDAHRGLARYLGGGGIEPPAGVDVSVTNTGAAARRCPAVSPAPSARSPRPAAPPAPRPP